jgi:cytochrome c551/c552
MRYFLAAVLLAYLPFLGILIAGSAASLVLNFLGRENRNEGSLRLSRELVETAAFDCRIFFPAALLPLPLIAFLSQRILPEPGLVPWLFWTLPFGALLSGCALLFLYRSAIRRTTEPPVLHFRAGAAGLLAVVLASFLLLLLLGTLFTPEKLPLIRGNPVFLLSYKSLTGFLLFLALSFGLTGGIALFRLGRPPAGTEAPQPGYRETVRSVGSSLAVGGALAVPALVVLNLISLPDTGLSAEVFVAAAAVVVLAFAVVLFLRRFPERGPANAGTGVSILFLLMFCAVLAGDQAAVANAFLGRQAPRKPPVPAGVAEGHLPGPAEPAVEKGRTVFQNVCRSCHLIESRMVGPALSEVLPKYRGNLENLKGYIRDPAKVDPDYPLMPHLGLKEEEVDAVARYLMTSVGMEKLPEAPAAGLPAEERGKAVFETVCSSCHRFDTRLVGPPFKDVVPKYTGNVEWLKRFIRDPVKTSAGYPAMPKLGLKEEEIDAVARYLLASVGMEKPRETPAAAMPAAEMGKAVLERVCSVCHRVDTRLVGPPFKDVVPKYKGNVEGLKGFIRNPAKVDPVYPAMPKHALKEEEIDAVARFLLASVGKETLPEKPAAAMPPGEKGKAVFESVCSVCHRFDTRLVGPPFNEVVPKYEGNVEGLKGFIRNPVKVNPAYPAMPKHALKEEEIDAVARYLLKNVGKGG